MGVILTALFAVISANALWELLSILVSRIVGEKGKDMSDKYVTLDEFMNERGDFVKQIVYKVDGDFNGNIEGENVTVILMGDGDINGNIDSKNGEIFINKGNVNGDIRADKVLMPNKKKDTYFGRRGIVVRCPHCDELYTQSLSINGYTSEDDANLVLDVKIDVEEPLNKSPDVPPTCHSCKYYSSYNDYAHYYYCEKLKDIFCNPYNTCGRYVERI